MDALKAFLLTMKSKHMAPEWKDRLIPDIRKLLSDTSKDMYRHCGFDDSTRFDLQVTLGDFDGVKAASNGKVEAIKTVMLTKTIAEVQAMIDRPMLIAIEHGHTRIIEYLLGTLEDKISKAIRSIGRVGSEYFNEANHNRRSMLYQNTWYNRQAYYIEQAIKMGNYKIAKFLLDSSDEGDTLDSIINAESLYRLLKTAEASEYKDLYKRIFDIYRDRVTFIVDEAEEEDEIEFILAHPVEGIPINIVPAPDDEGDLEEEEEE